ncbi:hypothetical protein GCM10028787_32760 [Brachybacterium horti]
MTLSSYPQGVKLTELDGRTILPPLIRTPRGWAERPPSRCGACEGTQLLVGWTACACRTDTLAPGHRTWTCQTCGQHDRLGCLDATSQARPMQEYGCRSSQPDNASTL